MSMMKRTVLCLAPVLFFCLLPVLATAQDNMGKTMTATGCLKQGTDAGGYYLMGEDGKMYELWGKNLGEHLNHKVTVTGTQTTMSAAQEKKREAMEKQEAGNATIVDMKVSNLKMISESCQ